jgi:1-acyl-sn-glycerol-3-phosphate acyltransferase
MLTPNHLSNWDLPFVHNLAPRSFYTMSKEEFLKIPVLGGICRLMGAFPVRRGTPDRRALQTSINVLKEGNMFLIFPEGTRSKTQALNEGHGGAAVIALAADAWIIPVALTGTEYIYRKRKSFLSRPKVTVRVGQPYKLSRLDENGRKISADEMGDQIMEHIAELLPDEYRGKYSQEAIAERKAARLQSAEAHSARRATRKAGP